MAGELTDKVPADNVSVASKAVYHEGGALEEESEVGGVRDSDSGSSIGIIDGSAAKVDSLGSVRSGAGARSDSRSETDSGRGVTGGVRDSGSGSSAGVVDGSAAKIDSLGSVRSGAGARSDSRSETMSG